MINKKIFELKIQMIINNNLFKKNIIDETIFSIANDKLLKNIKSLQNAKKEKRML